MMHAFVYTLCRRGVMAIFDSGARDLSNIWIDHWLRNSKNIIMLRLQEPAWGVSGQPRHSYNAPVSFGVVVLWTVAELAQMAQ